MHKNEVIKSAKIPAGSRTYFIDIKQTRTKAKYLKITESKRMENGLFEKHKVILFEEDIQPFMKVLSNALKYFPSYKMPGESTTKQLPKASV